MIKITRGAPWTPMSSRGGGGEQVGTVLDGALHRGADHRGVGTFHAGDRGVDKELEALIAEEAATDHAAVDEDAAHGFEDGGLWRFGRGPEGVEPGLVGDARDVVDGLAEGCDRDAVGEGQGSGGAVDGDHSARAADEGADIAFLYEEEAVGEAEAGDDGADGAAPIAQAVVERMGLDQEEGFLRGVEGEGAENVLDGGEHAGVGGVHPDLVVAVELEGEDEVVGGRGRRAAAGRFRSGGGRRLGEEAEAPADVFDQRVPGAMAAIAGVKRGHEGGGDVVGDVLGRAALKAGGDADGGRDGGEGCCGLEVVAGVAGRLERPLTPPASRVTQSGRM